jgi:hypothetical protein
MPALLLLLLPSLSLLLLLGLQWRTMISPLPLHTLQSTAVVRASNPEPCKTTTQRATAGLSTTPKGGGLINSSPKVELSCCLALLTTALQNKLAPVATRPLLAMDPV